MTKVIRAFESDHIVQMLSPILLEHLIIHSMSAIFLLIGFSLLVALVFLGIFLWAVRSGQYEDSYTPSVRMLFDDGTIESNAPSTENTELDKR